MSSTVMTKPSRTLLPLSTVSQSATTGLVGPWSWQPGTKAQPPGVFLGPTPSKSRFGIGPLDRVLKSD